MAHSTHLKLRQTAHVVRSSVAQALPTRRVVRNWVRARLQDTWLAKDVPFADLRHDEKPVHLAEGYGGHPIETFPPFGFYVLSEAGRAEEARERYTAWYREQFDKYVYMEKSVGGMKNGTLYKLVIAMHEHQHVPVTGERPEFRSDLVDRAIAQRVEERFALLRSIKHGGYERSPTDPVIGVARAGKVVLANGHHRAAALRVIQRAAVPGVLVVSPATKQLLRWFRIA